LDAAIGDADHGTNMDRGFTAVVAKLEETDGPVSPGRLLITAGGTLVSTVGGASGPLWGTALRRAGRALGEADEFGSDELASALGERSIGHQDPGATSTTLILGALARTVSAER